MITRKTRNTNTKSVGVPILNLKMMSDEKWNETAKQQAIANTNKNMEGFTVKNNETIVKPSREEWEVKTKATIEEMKKSDSAWLRSIWGAVETCGAILPSETSAICKIQDYVIKLNDYISERDSNISMKQNTGEQNDTKEMDMRNVIEDMIQMYNSFSSSTDYILLLAPKYYGNKSEAKGYQQDMFEYWMYPYTQEDFERDNEEWEEENAEYDDSDEE